MRLFVLTLALALLASGAHAQQTEEEFEEMEEQRIQQALDNLSSNKGELQENSFYKFEQMGEEAVPRLVELIREKKVKRLTIINAAHALGRLGPDGRQGAPALVALLKDKDRDIRAVAAIALGKIGPGAREGVPLLSKLLYDEDAWVSKSAYESLKKIRTEAALHAIKEYNDAKESGRNLPVSAPATHK